MNWNPETAKTLSDVGLDYQGVLRVGGRDTTQQFIQSRFPSRRLHALCHVEGSAHLEGWGGSQLPALRRDEAAQNGNPVFRFRQDEQFAFPFEAAYGVGNPDLSTDNRQFGFYVQDDWTPNPMKPRLTFNLGLRWDYESDMLNNNYVTPDDVRVATAPFVDANRYFTDGSDRPPFYGAWQPRVGLSYDLTGSGKHVLFGGYGRY